MSFNNSIFKVEWDLSSFSRGCEYSFLSLDFDFGSAPMPNLKFNYNSPNVLKFIANSS